MDLYIDLKKGTLNTSKLVRKPVQVRGKNGKIFTRMQWVDPHDASVGHGVRKITSKEGYHHALQQGIHKHPHFKQAMKDQNVHIQHHDSEHHPPFYLPETHESSDRFSVDSHHHAEHAPHGMKHSSHKVLESKEDIQPNYHTAVKDTKTLIDSIATHDSSHHSLQGIEEVFENHLESAHKLFEGIEDGIRSHEDDLRMKNTKLACLATVEANYNRYKRQDHINRRKPIMTALHPDVAEHTCKKVLGDKYDYYMKKMENANITINYDRHWKDDIFREGYKAATLLSHVEKHMGQDAVEHVEELLEHYDDTEEIAEKLWDYDEYEWDGIEERMLAEYHSIGLEAVDQKPTYIAFNPTGHKAGGAPTFGDGVIEVDESILSKCTSTMDDSFFDQRAVPSIRDMDHLKHIYMLRMIHGDSEDTLDSEPSLGTIPIELQYHESVIEPHLLRDPNHEYEDNYVPLTEDEREVLQDDDMEDIDLDDLEEALNFDMDDYLIKD